MRPKREDTNMPYSDSVMEMAQQLRGEDTDLVLATVVRAGSQTSTKSGAKVIITADGRCAGETAATAVDPVCGMSVKIAGAEYVSSESRQSCCFCRAGCPQRFDAEPQRHLRAQEVS